MPEIEDVSGGRARGSNNGCRLADDRRRVREQHLRIEIALQRDPAAKPPARAGQVDRPVETHARGTAVRDRIEPLPAALREHDRWHGPAVRGGA
jgi:hypothetical protein